MWIKRSNQKKLIFEWVIIMKPIKIVKLDTSINFLSKTKLFVSLSLIFIIASISIILERFKFCIDFNGGTLIGGAEDLRNADVSGNAGAFRSADLGKYTITGVWKEN